MGKSLKERLMEIRRERKTKYVNFFNDGSINTDDNYFAENMKVKDSIEPIADTLVNAARSYSYSVDFDHISMNLLLGLIYDIEDVDSNNNIKEGASPVNNLVRFYTGSVKSTLDGQVTNPYDYYKYGQGRQGYINYDTLLSCAKKEGMTFEGPESFEEFKEKILSSIPFEVTISADLKREKEMKLTRRM